jgi:hypothetical protein
VDDIVKQAMAKWPNVPSVFGWLALDRRGNWLIKGETISNPQINEFINRNYLHDDTGRWFFQNGPQRVFVELAYTPLVYGVPDHPKSDVIHTHTRRAVHSLHAAWIDDSGTLLLQSEHGIGHVHDQDLEWLLPRFVDAHGAVLDEDTLEARFDVYAAGRHGGLCFQLDATRVTIDALRASEAAARFGYVPHPQ